MGFFKRTLSGMAWITTLRASIRVTTIIRISILARLLTPAQFGSFGIASLSLSLLEILTETGINSVLLQENKSWTQYLNTAWIISLLRGFLISLLIIIFAPVVANFFNSPDSLRLLYFTALIPFIRGFINPASIKFQKELQFGREFFYRLAIILVETIVVVIFAFAFHDSLSMIIGLIAAAATEVLLSFVIIQPHPRLSFRREHVLHILNRGKWVTGFGVTDYIYSNFDNIAVGHFLGQASLGIYQNAYKFSLLPLTELVTVFYKVTFPVFSYMSNYANRLKSAAIKSSLLLTGLLLTACTFIYLLAAPIVQILLGSAWLEAIPVIRVLSLVAFIRGVTLSFNPLMMALKKQKYVSIVTFCNALALSVSIIPMVNKFGLMGAGYAALIGAVAAVPVWFYLTYKTFQVSFK